MAEVEATQEVTTTLAPGSHVLTEAELWARRFDVMVRRSAGEPVYKIAESYAVTPHTIYNDIDGYHRAAQLWLNIERSLLTVVNHYDHILWEAQKEIEHAREGIAGVKFNPRDIIPRCLSEMNKAAYGKAVVFGLIKPEINNHTNVVNIIQPARWGRRKEKIEAQAAATVPSVSSEVPVMESVPSVPAP